LPFVAFLGLFHVYIYASQQLSIKRVHPALVAESGVVGKKKAHQISSAGYPLMKLFV
jgi:hypothetical protein